MDMPNEVKSMNYLEKRVFAEGLRSYPHQILPYLKGSSLDKAWQLARKRREDWLIHETVNVALELAEEVNALPCAPTEELQAYGKELAGYIADLLRTKTPHAIAAGKILKGDSLHPGCMDETTEKELAGLLLPEDIDHIQEILDWGDEFEDLAEWPRIEAGLRSGL